MDLVVARRTGVLMLSGRRHMVRRGETIAHVKHPLVQQHPAAWKPLRVHHDVPAAGGGVEQATAAPGELRRVPAAELVCDLCGVTAKSAAGLAAHKRSHG